MSAAWPPKGAKAFDRISEDTTPSQAAVLLSLGKQLSGGDAPLQARAAALRRKGYVAAEPDAAEFPVPKLKGISGPVSFDESRQRLQRMHGYKPRARAVAVADAEYPSYEKAYRDSAHRLFEQPTATNAADLFALCLDHPKLLVRIAAVIASLRLTARPEISTRVLVQGLKSSDELERAVAATGLARYRPDHPALRALSRRKPARRVRKPPETLMLVHGTWASDAACSRACWKSAPCSISSAPCARIAAFFSTELPCGTTSVDDRPWRRAAKAIDCPWLPRVALMTPRQPGSRRRNPSR